LENNKEEATFSPRRAEQKEVRYVEGDENVQSDEMNIGRLTPEPNTMTQVQAPDPSMSQGHYLFQVFQAQKRAIFF